MIFIRAKCRFLPISKNINLQTRLLAQASVKSDLIIDVSKMLAPKKDKFPTRAPFAKNFALGKFDYEFMAYVEPQSDERYNDFEKWLEQLRNYIKSIKDDEIIKSSNIPQEVLENLKDLGVYGVRIHEDYKGMNLLFSEYLRVLEILSYIPGLGNYFVKQGIAPVDIFSKYGTVDQKWKYLTKMANGQSIPVVCSLENGNDPVPKKFETAALLSVDQQSWTLHGRKILVPNINDADVFLVLAHAMVSGAMNHRSETISALIVDKSTNGIIVKPENKFIGLPGYNVGTVEFKEVEIPKENILGEYGDGNKMLSEIFASRKLYTATQLLGLLRHLMDSLTQHVIDKKHFKLSMYECDYAQQAIAKTACSIYGIESALYLTSGMMDLYENQDIDLESTLVEIYAIEECHARVHEAMNLFGINSCITDHNHKQFLLDAHTIINCETSLNDSKMYAAILSMQHFGKEMADKVKKLRNPLMHPPKSLYKEIKDFFKNQTDCDLHIEEYLHPSLMECAEYLDRAIFRLKDSSEKLLVRHGSDIDNHHTDLHRLSELAKLVYIYSAILSRASRSYCIGHRDSDAEIKLCLRLAHNLLQRCDVLKEEIDAAEFANGDVYGQELSGVQFRRKEYFAAHPLARNY